MSRIPLILFPIGFLTIEIIRVNTKGKKNLKFPLIDLEFQKKPIPKIDFEKKISTTPDIYKKIFRDLEDFENVTIKCTNKNILFTYKDINGNGSELNDEYILDEDGIDLENSSTDKDFVATYPIKYITQFTKCTNYCEKISIFMKNEYSLSIQYPFVSFGTIVLILSPINPDCVKNVDYDYSDDEDDIEIIQNNTNKVVFNKK